MNNWDRALVIIAALAFASYLLRVEYHLHEKLGYVGRVLGAQERALIQLKEKDWGCIR